MRSRDVCPTIFIAMLWLRTNRLIAAMLAVIALLVLADVVIAARVFVPQSASVVLTADKATHKGHPCNHGFYVSQAAHAKKGDAYVSSIAKGNLGKNGNCTAPLPAK